MTSHIRMETGIDGLDLILDGGLRRPRDGSLLIVILGGPGTGKTHLALELTVRMLAQTGHSRALHLYYTLDQTPAEIHAKLREDFGYYGIAGDWSKVAGTIRSHDYEALLHTLPGTSGGEEDRYLLLGSLHESLGRNLSRRKEFFERIDGDILAFTETLPVGSPMRPCLVTIDNVTLAPDDDSCNLRFELSRIRQRLFERRLNGIFVLETPHEGSDLATFTAAEYAADVIVRLGYHDFGDQFQERSLEIAKARHQFYFRGTHHFSIVGRSGDKLRGARGQRPPGIHIYPSIPTLLSYLEYRTADHSPSRDTVAFGLPDLSVRRGSANGLLGPSSQLPRLYGILLRFLLAESGTALMISFQQSGHEIMESARRWFSDEEMGYLKERIHVRTFAPEYISAGKFLKDVYDDLEQLRSQGRQVQRAALCGIGHLRWGFPLLHDAKMLIPWLVGFFKLLSVTSLFVESTPPDRASTFSGEGRRQASGIDATVDNLFTLAETEDQKPVARIARSLSAEWKGPRDTLDLSFFE